MEKLYHKSAWDLPPFEEHSFMDGIPGDNGPALSYYDLLDEETYNEYIWHEDGSYTTQTKDFNGNLLSSKFNPNPNNKYIWCKDGNCMVSMYDKNGKYLSSKNYPMENGVNSKTYYYRLRRVREFLCEEHRDIVPIACDIPAPVSSEIKIQSGNMDISMPCSVSPEILSAAIEALKC